MGKVVQVWVERGGVVGGVVVKAAGVWGVWGGVRRNQCLDLLRHFCDGGGVLGPSLRSVSQGGNPAGLEVGTS